MLCLFLLCGCEKTKDDQREVLGTLLMKACWDSNAGLAELLIKDGADPNTTDEKGMTALMLAAGNPRGDNAHLVNILLQKGADVSAKDNEGRTAMRLAFEKGYLGAVWSLLHKGGDPSNMVNSKGRTPLMEFAEKWNPNAGHLEPFLAKGVQVNAIDADGKTALIIAAASPLDHKWGLDAVSHLIGRGADLNYQDNQGRTALMAAAENGRLEIVKLLISKNPQVNTKDKEGKTALILALQNGHLDVIEALVKGGADVDTKDNSGRTALDYAEEMFSKTRDMLKSKEKAP